MNGSGTVRTQFRCFSRWADRLMSWHLRTLRWEWNPKWRRRIWCSHRPSPLLSPGPWYNTLHSTSPPSAPPRNILRIFPSTPRFIWWFKRRYINQCELILPDKITNLYAMYRLQKRYEFTTILPSILKNITWTLAPVTMLGLSQGLPSALRLFCHLRLKANPASIMASDDPTVPHPIAVSSSPIGALNRCAIMLTHRFCI